MRYLSLSLLILVIIPFLQPAFGADWYDSDWLKARKITIDSGDIDSDLTNYPLYVNITSVNIGTDTQADCDDFVFTDSTNVTKLDHEIETCDSTNDWLEVWVRIPTVASASDTDIFMYYDNAGASNQQNTQETWASNFVGVWHLNATFADSTSNGNDGTNTGTSAVNDEYIGDSRSWDGIDDSIRFGSDSTLDDIFSGGGSVSGWIYADTSGEGTHGRWLEKRMVATPVDTGWITDIGSESGSTYGMRLTLLTQNSPTLLASWINTNFDFTFGQWHYFSIAYDADSISNDPVFFVDGVSVGVTEVTSPTLTMISDTNAILSLGQQSQSETRTWDGNLDETRISNSILTANWIKADWECQRYDGSCITVGDEGEEPAAPSQSYSDTLAITDTLVFTGTGSQSYLDTLAITDTLVFTGTGAQVYTDTLAITDDLVFIYNDLNPDYSDTLLLTDVYTQLCTGTCGVVPTANAIILSVNKSPFILGIYSDATRMACSSANAGGIIYNTDDLNLNVCNSTSWILPDGTGT